MTISDPQQPLSRRAARALERERQARGGSATPETEATAEPAVVTDAIFRGGEPAGEPNRVPETGTLDVPIVRRRDLRRRPADAPPVDVTGAIILDPEVIARLSTGATPVQGEARAKEESDDEPEIEAVPEPIAAVPARVETAPVEVAVVEAETAEPDAEPVELIEPPAVSVFAPPSPGARPSWAAEPVIEAAHRAAEDSMAGAGVTPPATETAAAPAAVGADEAVSAPRAGVPEHHWTRQLESEPEEDSVESTLSREVGAGAGAVATNALIVPEPSPLDLSGPLTSTGEIILTGSIKLPPYGGGASAPAEASGEFDDLFEEDGAEGLVEVQPVSAISAAGGENALGTPMVAPVKPTQSNRMLTALLITACSLAVIVTGLIVTAVVIGMI